MKNGNNRLDMEQLVAEVEHAGRDARRQQALGDMIDRLGEERDRQPLATGHWSLATKIAAACIVFFVVTAVRIWFIPTRGGSMVAENTVSVPAASAPAAMELPADRGEEAAVPRRMARQAPATASVTEEEPAPVWPVEEAVAEATGQEATVKEEEMTVEPVEPGSYVAEEVAVPEEMPEEEQVAVASAIEEMAAPVTSVSHGEAAPAHARKRDETPKVHLTVSLFQRAEPSLMDGTMLSINLL